MGPQTAATLVYELGDIGRFKNSSSVASYARLAPKVANSADKSHHGGATKRGDAELRFILGQWAVRLMTRKPLVRKWALPKLQRLHKNEPRTALARRLAVGVYVALAGDEVFSLERCLAA